MTNARITELTELYRSILFDDVLPFWLKNSIDSECGGYMHCLDQSGAPYSTDKAIWIHCRAIWMFSTLYNTVERKPEWLDYARHGFEFLLAHGFDVDGRAFFTVTRDGRPLRKRRYLYSEAFAVIAGAAYFTASGDERALDLARRTYRLMIHLHRTPGLLEPKVFPATRRMKSHAMPMILLATTQELRLVDSDSLYDEVASDSVNQLVNHFYREDVRAVIENVTDTGEYFGEIPAGRLVNPGHAIESAWFLMHEAIHRGDSRLIAHARNAIDWSLELGWDRQYGGLYSFIDVEGKQPEQLEWDMKMWWPHTEAMYSLLLASHLTDAPQYEQWFERIHHYTVSHFPDPAYGEWFMYLHRDGTVASTMKGSIWKGPFHIPRALWLCLRLLKKMANSR